MNPVQYIIANQGLRMSSGKLAAQVAHASVKGAMASDDMLYAQWNASGHTKIVLAARDNDHMLWIDRYLADQGFQGYMIIDEGRTEVPPLSPTALGFPILDKDDEKVKFAFSTFKLYKDLPPEIIITPPPERRGGSSMTGLVEAVAILALVALNAWQHLHHEQAVARWRREREGRSTE